jgi:hypothetical protein
VPLSLIVRRPDYPTGVQVVRSLRSGAESAVSSRNLIAIPRGHSRAEFAVANSSGRFRSKRNGYRKRNQRQVCHRTGEACGYEMPTREASFGRGARASQLPKRSVYRGSSAGGKAHASSMHWAIGSTRKRRVGKRQAIDAVGFGRRVTLRWDGGSAAEARNECSVPGSFGPVVAGRLTMRCRRTRQTVSDFARGRAKSPPVCRAAELNR